MLLSKKRFHNIKNSNNQSQKKYKKKRRRKKKGGKARSFRRRRKRKLNLRKNSLKRYKHLKGGAVGMVYLFPPSKDVNTEEFPLIHVHASEMISLKEGFLRERENTASYMNIKRETGRIQNMVNRAEIECSEVCQV